jgi:hypothetical protein
LVSCGQPFRDLVTTLAPDVLHVHGLGFRRMLPLAELVPGVPILLQDHADRPSRSGGGMCFGGIPRGFGLRVPRASRQPFTHAGSIHANSAIFEAPESTARFTPGAVEARRRTGCPAVRACWVGHLIGTRIPSPRRAVAAARQLPDSMGSASRRAMADVRQRIGQDEWLQGMLGCVRTSASSSSCAPPISSFSAVIAKGADTHDRFPRLLPVDRHPRSGLDRSRNVGWPGSGDARGLWKHCR